MKPPRYILREAALKQLFKNNQPGHFLEIGYGGGETLVTLAESGYTGVGYDFSERAYTAAKELLSEKMISGINLVESLGGESNFQLILFFEVIGYFKDPVKKLHQFRNMLTDNGEIVFSFTNKKNIGLAEKVTGEMRCFNREEISEILSKSGFEAEKVWNYGFPLTNIMRPFLDGYFFLKQKFGEEKSQKAALHESGMEHKQFIMKLVGLVLNPVTLYPFTFIQKFFKNSDLGTGYLVLARKTNPRS